MSRSYKKNPINKYAKNPAGKREANKKTRRSNNIPNGRGFKKLFCSYNICDCKCDWRNWFIGKERASDKALEELNKIKRK